MPAAKKKAKVVEKEIPAEMEKVETVEEKEEAQASDQPQQAHTFRRGEDGLIVGYPYEYDDLGRICWKSLIDRKYIKPNRDRLAEKDIDPTKLTEEEIAKLPEEDTIVLLQGFKNLMEIRGYASIEEECSYSNGSKIEKAIATCKVNWLPNAESNIITTVQTVGEAHYHNTFSFGQQYLIRMACNRALVANVRMFLRIPILGADELGGAGSKPEKGKDSSLAKAVEALCKRKGFTYERLKERIVDNFDDIEDCNSFEDLENHWTNPKVLEFIYEKMKDIKDA